MPVHSSVRAGCWCRLCDDRRGALSRVAAAVVVLSISAAAVADEAASGVRVPDGFEVTLYAGDELAHDVYSMTIDAEGRVVVSGAGYVRILVDADGDGRAESFQEFADGPRTGAQGMHCDGRDLVCTGDGGLIRYRDADGDDRADGPPEVLLKMKTGGEHHAHAVRRGPDGWWYVIAGNFGEITADYVTRPATSPVRKPQAGVILRLTPDFKECEIVCDGFRNAYDFDFNPPGDVFVYDSDGERDVSLPWYRPTRVFHMLSGAHAGWITRSWKRADDSLDMPPVIAGFGRGSPTGVVCYRHRQFPERYRGAVFVLDWTFGRVLALPLEADGSTWMTAPIDFMTGVGSFGFAATDAAVGPDGSLFVSVGGRGTQGGVFRVRWAGDSGESGRPAAAAAADSPADALARCLAAPQPLSSWSRAEWLPLAERLGREPFIAAALDDNRDAAERVRAVEIVTELFGGFDEAEFARLAVARPADVRARAGWSWGRAHGRRSGLRPILLLLADRDPRVVRCALEALQESADDARDRALLVALTSSLGSRDRFVRQSAARLVARLPREAHDQLAALMRTRGEQALLAHAYAGVAGAGAFDAAALEVGLGVLEGDGPREVQLEAARLVQLALGDLGSNGKLAAVFDGYATPLDLSGNQAAVEAASRLVAIFPSGDDRIDAEVARALAMLAPPDGALLDRLLERIGKDSHPVDDIHYLIVSARVPVERTAAQRARIAQALAGLEPKVQARGLHQDLHWEERVGEMYARHVELDPALPEAIIAQPRFGSPGHVFFVAPLPKQLLPRATAAFVRRIEAEPEYEWTPGLAYLLGDSNDPAHRELLRRQLDNFAVRDAILLVLAERPEETDREWFIAGLESSAPEVLDACVKALMAVPVGERADELFALVRLLRRLGTDKSEYPLRESVVRLLRRNTGREFGFVFGRAGHRPQREAVALWTGWLAERYPDAAAREFGGGESELAELKPLLARVDWSGGDAARGGDLFETRSCARCHGGRQALGPDLAGITQRFSREDLLTAIAAPSRDVSPRYQTTLVQTSQGKIYTGLVVYESVDGLLLRDGTGRTFRIEAEDIEVQRRLPTSLMPAGLLKGLTAQDLADLYAYMESLGAARTAGR